MSRVGRQLKYELATRPYMNHVMAMKGQIRSFDIHA
jgi:hypothetical protein